ncbi:hypothetical protein [Kribbella deserti]|uniref:ABC transporter permease n=1 Tax=Kribbella deserti TaxID=1926257 RepID=A0ABV6QL38_9ACTN
MNAKTTGSELGVLGLVLAVQGFGSGIAEAGWQRNWGLLAVAERWTTVPAWAGFAIGVVGLMVALSGAAILSTRRSVSQ